MEDVRSLQSRSRQPWSPRKYSRTLMQEYKSYPRERRNLQRLTDQREQKGIVIEPQTRYFGSSPELLHRQKLSWTFRTAGNRSRNLLSLIAGIYSVPMDYWEFVSREGSLHREGTWNSLPEHQKISQPWLCKDRRYRDSLLKPTVSICGVVREWSHHQRMHDANKRHMTIKLA